MNRGTDWQVNRPNFMTGLEGVHWGLLPALIFSAWLIWYPPLQGIKSTSFFLLATLMAAYDLADRRIPNVLTGATALLGLLLALLTGGWLEGLRAMAGGLVGFGLMAVFFFLGAMGAGDVKALGSLAVFVGPLGGLELFIFTCLSGGFLAMGRVMAARRGLAASILVSRSLEAAKGLKLPYGLAIWAGCLLYLIIGGGRL